MRLNVGQCKVMYFAAKKNEQPSMLTLSNVQLEIISSYENLGVDLNNEEDSFMQWSRVSGLIKPNIYLLKQLKSSGLEERILVNAKNQKSEYSELFRKIYFFSRKKKYLRKNFDHTKIFQEQN